jgi:hypothetical protein
MIDRDYTFTVSDDELAVADLQCIQRFPRT